jgi:hypothetical protein
VWKVSADIEFKERNSDITGIYGVPNMDSFIHNDYHKINDNDPYQENNTEPNIF